MVAGFPLWVLIGRYLMSLALSVPSLPHLSFGHHFFLEQTITHFGLKSSTKRKSFDWREKDVKLVNRQGRYFLYSHDYNSNPM